MIIQRVNCDYYNNEDHSVEAVCDYNVTTPIINSADEYRLVVETAEVSLSEMPLDMDSDFVIRREYRLSRDEDPNNEFTPIVQYYRFPKQIQSVSNFIRLLNLQLNDGGIPPPGWDPEVEYDARSLIVFNIDKDNLLYVFNESRNTQHEKNMKFFINKPLRDILNRFAAYNQLTYKSPEGDKDMIFYQLYYTEQDTKQDTVTVNNLIKFKSVRFITNLPVRSYKVYRQNLEQMVETNILTTIKINSSTFNTSSQKNLLYIPTEFREIELVSNEAITNFQIYIEIYYSSGHIFRHRLAPGEYFELALAFKQYKINSVE